MKRISITISALVLSVCSIVVSVKGQDREIDVAVERVSGDKIRGPATLKLKNLNVLRYDIQIGSSVTFIKGPDLTLPFIPPIPSKAAEAQGGAGAAAGDPITGSFGQIVQDLDGIDDERVQRVELPIGEAISTSNATKGDLEALVLASDSLLRTPGGPRAIINGINPLLDRINNALGKTWPDLSIREILGRLERLKLRLLILPTTPVGPGDVTWDQWIRDAGRKSSYDAALARIEELRARLTSLDSDSEAAKKFRDAQNKFSQWRPILIGVRDGGSDAFTRIVRVGCSFGFDQTKSTKVEVIRRDRLADAASDEIRLEIVTVECSSPLSISGGFGFSSVDEREFVFVQSVKDGVNDKGEAIKVPINTFGFRNRSSFRTLPVLLLNTRFWEPNDSFAFHASAGAAVDIKTGEAGTDLEFIVGPSLSFKRTLFLTPGLHIGRVPSLVGGFELGQEVPEGINAPPIEKTWRKGFVVTFTFKLR